MRDIILDMVCPFCGAEHFVEVNEVDYNAWVAGKMAQHAFPYLSPTEREQVISHLCPACQDSFFEEDDE